MSDGKLSSDTWGAQQVIPRFIDNGIEDQVRSYFCLWLAGRLSQRTLWVPNSIVYHTVSDNRFGPYHIQDTIGPGHNPEAFKTRSGKYVIYVIDHYYLADNINGPWTRRTFDFDPRDRKIIEGLSNLTVTQREDGSYLMICRGGGVWISQTGFYLQSNKRPTYLSFGWRWIWRSGCIERFGTI